MTTLAKLEISQDELLFFLSVAIIVAGGVLAVVL